MNEEGVDKVTGELETAKQEPLVVELFQYGPMVLGRILRQDLRYAPRNMGAVYFSPEELDLPGETEKFHITTSSIPELREHALFICGSRKENNKDGRVFVRRCDSVKAATALMRKTARAVELFNQQVKRSDPNIIAVPGVFPVCIVRCGEGTIENNLQDGNKEDGTIQSTVLAYGEQER